MAARNKPYEQFGPYVLFKKLEQDSLGDLWRAGRIEGGQVGPTLALRRLAGGNRSALTTGVEAVAQLLPRLTGPSFARDQIAGVADGVPFLAWDYAGGRSLRYIIDRARGGKDTQPNPLPLDQAIVVAEKTALSLATIGDLRDSAGTRLSHGALLPQFIWISDDGEIRVGGQQIAPGLVASLSDQKIAAEIGRYFAPELRSSGQSKNADVYALGAILFLLVTGQEPPDAITASAFVSAVRATKTMLGTPVPDDIRIILDKSFNLDASMRYPSMTEMKQAISALAHGGKYSASTFNLAFYLSTLLKKDMEAEALEREKETKLNVAPYLEAPKPVTVERPLPASEPAMAVPMFAGAHEPKAKSKLPIGIAAAVILAAVGGGAYMMMGRNSAQPATTTSTNAQMIPTPAPAPKHVLPEPILASGSTATSTAPVTTTAGDAAAQKRAFEEAVRQKLQSEMSKLNEQYMSELQRQQSRNAPVAAPAPVVTSPPVAEDRGSVSAAQLDQQRREAARQEDVAETRAPAPVPTQTVAQQQPSAPVPAPTPTVAAPATTVREGDVVQYSALDSPPRATRRINAVYPPAARQQRISGTVILSALIDENGVVTDVKVLRGVGRMGIDESATRAMRSARFTPPMKDGKRVKTWWPQTIQFEP